MAKIPKWVTRPKYLEMTGLTKCSLQKLMDEGKVTYERTEGGRYHFLLTEDTEGDELKAKVEHLESMVSGLCRHLGVQVDLSM